MNYFYASTMQRWQLNIFILVILFTGFNYSVTAQAKFTAKISPATIGKDEMAELKLLVENAANVQNITPPALDKFIIISGPNQESGMESINGITTQYTGITFILKPKTKGDFTIGAATASADGKTLKSNAVKIKVVNEPTGNSISSNSPFSGLMNFDEPVVRRGSYSDYILKKGENITDKINRNIFIKVDASKTSCYVGEPILVTYKLYTRLKSESNITKNPSFNGFSVIDMLRSNDISALVEKLNGWDYNVYSLRQTQLYPLQPGNVELESASVENEIHFVKEDFLRNSREDDLFGNFSSISIPADALVKERVTLQSKPVTITVKPLPEQGKPVSFNGAVGNFAIHAAMEKASLTTDDAGKLFITIEGEGNLMLVNAPEFDWPTGVEAFEPSMKESLDKRSVPVSGNKTFEYSFTINKEGNYTLPPVEYSFFDPATGQYKTIATVPITFSVAKGSGKKTKALEVLQDKSANENFFDTIFKNRWLIIAPLAMLILAGLFVWVRWDKKRQLAAAGGGQKNTNTPAEKVPEIKKPLSGSQAMLQHNVPREFYSMLDKELKIFLGEKLQLPAEQMNRRTIGSALYNAGFADEDSIAVLQLLDDIAAQLYTPVADESKAPYFYKKAEAVIHLFNSSNT
jgi:hypothetical protein